MRKEGLMVRSAAKPRVSNHEDGRKEPKMQTSKFLARLMGPFMVAIGAGLLVNGDVLQAMAAEFLKSPALIFLSGLLTLTAGLAIVNTHNVWTTDWRVIVTIFGWLGVIGGADLRAPARAVAELPRLPGAARAGAGEPQGQEEKVIHSATTK